VTRLPECVLPSSGLKALPVQTLSPCGFMSKNTCCPTFAGSLGSEPDDRAAQGVAATQNGDFEACVARDWAP